MPQASIVDVLVVDDQRAMRALVKETLAQLGFQRMSECGDGQEALEYIRKHPPHLIISDLNMPRLDGLGLLKAVRADARWNGVAFIMLTSRGDVDLVKKAVALGVNNYLMKPFSLNGLKTKVEAVIGPLT